jgi:hypothetical protein
MNKTPSRIEHETIAGLQRRSRRGFLSAAIAAVAGAGIWKWLNSRAEVDGLVSPFRRAMEFNAGLARRLFRERALAPEFEHSKAVRSFRRNGDIGLSEIRPEDWRLQLVGVSNPASYVQYSRDVSSWTYGMNTSSAAAPGVHATVAPKKLGMHEQDAKGAAVKMKAMEMPEDMSAGVPGAERSILCCCSCSCGLWLRNRELVHGAKMYVMPQLGVRISWRERCKPGPRHQICFSRYNYRFYLSSHNLWRAIAA